MPMLKRKIAVAAAAASTKAAISRLDQSGMSNDRPNERNGVVCRNSVCSANQIDRLRITPTTAAVIAVRVKVQGQRASMGFVKHVRDGRAICVCECDRRSKDTERVGRDQQGRSPAP